LISLDYFEPPPHLFEKKDPMPKHRVQLRGGSGPPLR
jgi:hypothetical protein